MHLSIFPQGKFSNSNVFGCKYPVHPDTPTLIEWIIGGRVQEGHPSKYVPALGNSTSKFHGKCAHIDHRTIDHLVVVGITANVTAAFT